MKTAGSFVETTGEILYNHKNNYYREVSLMYMQDILRGGITNDDPRIPRNVSK